jgi:hypothetical protein
MKIVTKRSLNLKERLITAVFMTLTKEIGAIIIAIVGIFTFIGYLGFASTIVQDTSRLSQGDSSAASDLGNAVADQAIGEIQWGLGIAVLIVICSALGLGSIVAVLKRL